MHKILSVAWRDFRHTVLTKAFIFAVIGIPILVLGLMAITGIIMASHKPPALIGTVAIVDSSGGVAPVAAALFDPKQIEREKGQEAREAMKAAENMGMVSPGMGSGAAAASMARGEVKVTIEPHPIEDVEPLKQRVKDGELLALAIVTPEVLAAPEPSLGWRDRPSFNLFVGEQVENDHISEIEKRLARAIVRVRIQQAGHDPDRYMAMSTEPPPNTRRIMISGEEAQEDAGFREIRQIFIPMAFMMLLWIATFSSGQQLLTSTIEEKSNRVMEVLLSAVSPLQLMAGKIIGQGAAGLIIVAVYSSVGIASLIAMQQQGLIELVQLVYLAVYFFMAYFMVASLMAAVGSAVSDLREANNLLTPVMLILMIPLMLWLPISQAPNGGIATAFSFIPPAIPFAMILRVTADEPVPAWQILATMAWGYVCVAGMVWMAAKIFRVGVLMYGKPPSPIELIKWLRYS